MQGSITGDVKQFFFFLRVCVLLLLSKNMLCGLLCCTGWLRVLDGRTPGQVRADRVQGQRMCLPIPLLPPGGSTALLTSVGLSFLIGKMEMTGLYLLGYCQDGAP